jgi:hypothetical protein
MQKLEFGSRAARMLAENSPPGALSPYDFSHAMGSAEESPEGLEWLAAQPHTAARMALLDNAWYCWKHRDNVLTDPDLRAAVIRRMAVRFADDNLTDKAKREWTQSLTTEEHALAVEAVEMDTSLSPDLQAAALRDLETLHRQ